VAGGITGGEGLHGFLFDEVDGDLAGLFGVGIVVDGGSGIDFPEGVGDVGDVGVGILFLRGVHDLFSF
jgi:hypothetical protein